MRDWLTVKKYHQSTKHHPGRMARSLGYLDWANQPDPFRRYHGAPMLALPFEDVDDGPLFDVVYDASRAPRQPLHRRSIGGFLQYSLGLSAWKRYQSSQWALRINPSSGNLHPTECYLITGTMDDAELSNGLFHYAPHEHALERRCTRAVGGAADAMAQTSPATFMIGLTSIHWREAWKYGERAFRYGQHDVGHALAALAFSAAIQGWTIRPIHTIGDDNLATVLGLDRDDGFVAEEREWPALLAMVDATGSDESIDLNAELDIVIKSIREEIGWVGRANRLSAEPVRWPIIDEVAQASRMPTRAIGLDGESPSDVDSSACVANECQPVSSLDGTSPGSNVPARRILFRRRSALAMDGRSTLSDGQFYHLLHRVMPRAAFTPWCALRKPARVHLVFFVHRVVGLEPGLYLLVRRSDALPALRSAMRSDFAWGEPPGCAAGFPFYRLMVGDVRLLAGQLCCGQSIAADGIFAVSMIAEFEEPVERIGAWLYPRLFWETGVIGQVLYLEAEAVGVGATGIGCYFDDPTHDVLGLTGGAFQSLYHFTVGGAVDDSRLTTLPAYGHLGKR